MPKKPKSSSPPRSLFVPTPVPQGDNLVEFLKSQTASALIERDIATMEADAALRTIVRRDTGETYREMLTRMAK